MKKIIDGNEIKTITPEIIAELFCCLSADEQAVFFNHISEIASTWRGGGLSIQLQYITDDDGLTLSGRRVMQEIGEYSHWGMSCNLERETRKLAG